MNSEYSALVVRRAQLMMLICIVLAFSTCGVVAACIAFERQLERQALVDQERVKW